MSSVVICFATVSVAQDKKAPRDADLGKKAATAVDKSLAGDISRTKAAKDQAVPMQYDQFRLGVELQVASKRREQIESLKKIISLSADAREAPGLHFRLGELYWEEAKFFFIEANRKDDDLIVAMNKNEKSKDECDTDTLCSAAGVELRDDAFSAATVSTVGFALGGVGAASAAVLLIAAPSREKSATRPGLRGVHAGVDSRGAAITVDGVF